MTPLDSVHLLAKHVLLRAFRDLSIAGEQEDATAFLTGSTPAYKESLETWCAFARFDPARVVARTQQYITKGAFIAEAVSVPTH